MDIFHEITDLVEPLSLDEAYLDVTALVTTELAPAGIAADLRARVKAETGLTVSVGVATSKSVAKVASDMNKPDGLTIVPPGTERQFLAPLDIGKLWGIGPKTSERLVREGVRTIGDLAARPEEWFLRRFGKNGHFFRSLAMGIDDRPVSVSRERKSVSAETTLATDTGDPEALIELVERLSSRVAKQLAGKGLQGRTVKLKLRLSDFSTFTRQTTLPYPDDSPDGIAAAALELLRHELAHEGRRYRLVGVGISGFDDEDADGLRPPVQLRLAGM